MVKEKERLELALYSLSGMRAEKMHFYFHRALKGDKAKCFLRIFPRQEISTSLFQSNLSPKRWRGLSAVFGT